MLLIAKNDILQALTAVANPGEVTIFANDQTNAQAFNVTVTGTASVVEDDNGLLITVPKDSTVSIKQLDNGNYSVGPGKQLRLSNNGLTYCIYAVPEFSDSVFMKEICSNVSAVLNSYRSMSALALTATALGLLQGVSTAVGATAHVDLTDEQEADLVRKIRGKGIVIT